MVPWIAAPNSDTGLSVPVRSDPSITLYGFTHRIQLSGQLVNQGLKNVHVLNLQTVHFQNGEDSEIAVSDLVFLSHCNGDWEKRGREGGKNKEVFQGMFVGRKRKKKEKKRKKRKKRILVPF
jgi:hypothetical protein